jgi:hypothetical protein
MMNTNDEDLESELPEIDISIWDREIPKLSKKSNQTSLQHEWELCNTFQETYDGVLVNSIDCNIINTPEIRKNDESLYKLRIIRMSVYKCRKCGSVMKIPASEDPNFSTVEVITCMDVILEVVHES